MAGLDIDTVFRFYTSSHPVVFRFITEDHPPMVFRFQAGAEDTVFRFIIRDDPPTTFRFVTSSEPLKFRFKAGEATLQAVMEYEVSPTCKTSVIKLTLENLYTDEVITLSANYWNNTDAIRVQRAGDNWLIDLDQDGSYRIEFNSNMRGLVLMDYIFVHCNSSKRYNAYLLGNCGENEKLTDLKYQTLKALRRSAFSLHKAGQFKESKAMLDEIVNLTCDDRLY